MSAETGAVVAVRVPQVNVNDDAVTLVAWRIEDGGRAVEGGPLCEIETSKSVGDLPSPATGVLRHAAKVGDTIPIQGIVGYIGPSAEVIDAHLSALQRPDAGQPVQATPGGIQATAGAVELARRAGIDLAVVPAGEGRVRRSDVEKYLAERQGRPSQPSAVADDVLPVPLRAWVDEVAPLSNHEWAIGQHLKETQARIVVAHAMMDVNMRRAVEWINAQRQTGVMASPLPLLMRAAALACVACPRLQCFRVGRRMFRYRDVDIAFTARSHQGWLYAPVVRRVDQLSLTDLAGRCGELAMAAYRGQVAEKDLVGGCLTVSLLNEQPVRMHVGLQNVYQSAILTCGAVRDELHLVDDKPLAVPTVTLAISYDHGLLDGWDAAFALEAARRSIEEWTV